MRSRVQSHEKALAAIAGRRIRATKSRRTRSPITIPISPRGKTIDDTRTIKNDEGPRPGTTIEALAKLKTVFRANGSVTAGNSSQMSDGAGAVLLASEKAIKELQPHSPRALRRIRRRRRAAGNHGHRPESGDSESAEADRHHAGRSRLDRTQRSLRRAGARGDAGHRASIPTRSIRSAARLRSAIRSARPARFASQRSSTACAAASRSTAW